MTVLVGHGYDVHAFCDGDHVTLAGIRIPHSRGLRAHSDGDVVIHALCDAMLGAAGLGDIGGLFPDSDPANANRDSSEFLVEVQRLLEKESLGIGNLDVTIIAQAPRLADAMPSLKQNLARLLGIPEQRVNLKATTHERLGALGREEGIAAHAVVLLVESS